MVPSVMVLTGFDFIAMLRLFSFSATIVSPSSIFVHIFNYKVFLLEINRTSHQINLVVIAFLSHFLYNIYIVKYETGGNLLWLLTSHLM